MRARWITALLIVLGLARIAGAVLGLPWLEEFAAATGASPAPGLLSAAKGLEAGATRCVITWTDRGGVRRERALDAATLARLRGPDERRSVYGAALVAGPVLATDPRTRPLLEALLRNALCPPRPLFAELGIDPFDVAGEVRLHSSPRAGSALDGRPLELEPACP